ncbi:MAG: MFS transporter [Haloarculaceae archaeon]
MTASGLVGRQRVVIGLAGATQAASGGMLGTALVVYVGRTGSPLAVSMLATAFFVSSMLFAPLWGAVGDLLGRRRALLALSALTSLVTLGFLLVRSVWGFVGLRGLWAVFAVAFGPLMLSIVQSLVGRTHRGRSIGFVSSTAAAGDVGAQLSVGVLLGVLAPSSLFLVIGALSLLATALVAALDDSAAAPDPLSTRDLVANVRTRLVPDASERRRLRRTGLTWLYAGLALRHTAIKGIGALVPIYLVGRLGLPAAVMGGILAIGPAAQVGFMPLFGRLADRGNRKRLVVVGILLSAVYTLVLAASALPAGRALRAAVAAIGFVVIAAGFSAMDVGTVSIIGDSVPRDRESAFVGLRSTAAGIGGVLGPSIVGVTATLLGFPTAFAVASVFAFAAALLVAITLEEPTRTTPAPTALRTIETNTGVTQVPGMHRGENERG